MTKREKGTKHTPLPNPKPKRQAHAQPTPEEIAMSGRGEPPHAESPTSIAAEVFQTNLYPEEPKLEHVPSEDDLLRAGDPDVDPLMNELYGEEVPGGSMPTPDQANVDEIGRAYGIADVDSGALVFADDLLRRRDDK